MYIEQVEQSNFDAFLSEKVGDCELELIALHDRFKAQQLRDVLQEIPKDPKRR